MSESVVIAFENVFQLEVLIVILISAVYGIFMGAVPGLTATMAVALLVPMTFFLDDVTALAAIVTLSACAIFAGDIPSTLVRIPGTPSSAAFVDDAYTLRSRGQHNIALGTALLFSAVGGLCGAMILIAFAPQLAKIAVQFTSYEYFWLTLLGLSCAAVVSSGSMLKGMLALVIGLLLSMVGLSEVHSVPRFTFGHDELIAGIDFIPAMIGLFGMSEVLRGVMQRGREPNAALSLGEKGVGKNISNFLARIVWTPLRETILAAVPELWHNKLSVFRSSVVGFLVGMLPGAGADIGAWISYAVSKRFSKTPELYGKGSVEGIRDAASAKNSALAGAWVPALVFGIPGDSVTAIVIGVLLMKNVMPGPQIFTDPTQSILVHGIFITFILANLVLIPVGFVAIRVGGLLVRVPRRVLLPIILLF
ncbi:MAG: tripartite tricarboxylate transporter permease, partial [bacterium]